MLFRFHAYLFLIFFLEYCPEDMGFTGLKLASPIIWAAGKLVEIINGEN